MIRTPFERWVEDDLKLAFVRGHAAGPLGTLPLRRWEKRNLDAVFVDLTGAESLAGMYVAELAARQSSACVRHLCDETFYVLHGHGSTTIETPEGPAHFEWSERSLFAIPLNCPYQLHNGSGTAAARLVSVNTLPVVFDLYRDAAFVFGTEYGFDRAEPDAEYPDRDDPLSVTDLLRLARNAGANAAHIETAASALAGRITTLAGSQVVEPRLHGPAPIVFTLAGSGYTLLGPAGAAPQRVDWPAGDVAAIAAPSTWRHEHIVTSDDAVHLAVGFLNRSHPINHLEETA